MKDKKQKGWHNHSNHYSNQDIYLFHKIIPNLLSKIGRETEEGKMEIEQMMKRFEKSFGDKDSSGKKDKEE